MTTLVPETFHFATDHSPSTGQYIYQDAVNLVFQIGAATAQSNKSGFFLRQYANGADPCGLIGPTCVATNAAAHRAAPAELPQLPAQRAQLPCPPAAAGRAAHGAAAAAAAAQTADPHAVARSCRHCQASPRPRVGSAPSSADSDANSCLWACAQQASDQVATPLALWGWL